MMSGSAKSMPMPGLDCTGFPEDTEGSPASANLTSIANAGFIASAGSSFALLQLISAKALTAVLGAGDGKSDRVAMFDAAA